MPGLRLTLAQACRLWHVDRAVCEAILERLVRERFLRLTSDGAYTGPRNRRVRTVGTYRCSVVAIDERVLQTHSAHARERAWATRSRWPRLCPARRTLRSGRNRERERRAWPVVGLCP